VERKVKFLRIKWNGKTPRTFSLPIPFISLSEKEGEVFCNPIGDFPPADGQRLLDLEGSLAELIETIYEGETTKGANTTGAVSSVLGVQFSFCQCGCEKSVAKEGNRFIRGHSARYPKAPSQPQPEAGAVPV